MDKPRFFLIYLFFLSIVARLLVLNPYESRNSTLSWSIDIIAMHYILLILLGASLSIAVPVRRRQV